RAGPVDPAGGVEARRRGRRAPSPARRPLAARPLNGPRRTGGAPSGPGSAARRPRPAPPTTLRLRMRRTLSVLCLAAAALCACETEPPKTALGYTENAKSAYDSAMENFNAHQRVEAQNAR